MHTISLGRIHTNILETLENRIKYACREWTNVLASGYFHVDSDYAQIFFDVIIRT